MQQHEDAGETAGSPSGLPAVLRLNEVCREVSLRRNEDGQVPEVHPPCKERGGLAANRR